MLNFPPLRRLFLPTIILLIIILCYKITLQSALSIPTLISHTAPRLPPHGIRIAISALKHSQFPLKNSSDNHISPPKKFYYSFPNATLSGPGDHLSLWAAWAHPVLNPHLAPLFTCPVRANRFTKHIRISNSILNVSMIPPNASFEETRVFWNPTIISLPYWASNQYLIVGRIVTSGSHQQNVICEANICYTGSGEGRPENEKPCTKDDIAVLGANGGMRCAAPPVSLDVPPTPAEHCDGEFSAYVNIPGFHDPRIFWSGKGEPLIIVNTQSRYACFGLWIIDLRSVYPSLSALLASSPTFPSLGPLKSYPTLTELTRNPASDRFPIEKNWMLFFPTSSAYIHYEISPTGGRTFAKLLGGGLTTPNLTDPLEKPCLFSVPASEPDLLRHNGTWHQATNSLKAVLCHRSNESCTASPENTVFFSILHRKHENAFGLPMRYERYLFVWASTPPFGALAVSQYPLLLANETATGWSAAENWEGGEGEMWAYFTYTVSIAYAWGRPRDEAGGKNVGFLDDEVVLAIGIDDRAQAFTVVSVQDLLQCMRACPGRGLKSGGEEVSGGESAEGGR